jgi:hypothetical protein
MCKSRHAINTDFRGDLRASYPIRKKEYIECICEREQRPDRTSEPLVEA